MRSLMQKHFILKISFNKLQRVHGYTAKNTVLPTPNCPGELTYVNAIQCSKRIPQTKLIIHTCILAVRDCSFIKVYLFYNVSEVLCISANKARLRSNTLCETLTRPDYYEICCELSAVAELLDGYPMSTHPRPKG